MRRLLWLVLVGAVLVSIIAYAATYNATISTYSVGDSYNLQQINSTLVEPPNYSLNYLGTYTQKYSILRSINYNVLGGCSCVFHEPNDEWVDCSFLFRRPYLFYCDGSLTSVYISFSNDTDVYGNLSSYGGLIVAVDDVVVPFDYEVKESPGLIKVGIKPSSFGGTGDYVMIKVNGSWVHPVEAVSYTHLTLPTN